MKNIDSNMEFPEQNKKLHLSDLQRSFIILKLKEGMKCKDILNSWNPVVLEREPPSIQTIRKIKRELKKDDKVISKKKGPKTRNILTPQKLKEVEDVMINNDISTFRKLSEFIDLPLSTTHEAVKLLNFSQFDAIEVEYLSNQQKEMRVLFCTKF